MQCIFFLFQTCDDPVIKAYADLVLFILFAMAIILMSYDRSFISIIHVIRLDHRACLYLPQIK